MNKPIDRYPFQRKVPEGDNRERDVCDTCGWIHYVNPQVVVGTVARWDGKILLCRRAIEPRHGFWTIPAGYLEVNETSEAGAMRETEEEACARVEILSLLAVYNIPRISQVQLIYLADVADGEFAPGEESLETRLFAPTEIPWDRLAFPTVRWALQQYESLNGLMDFPTFGNPPGKTGRMDE